MVKIADRFTAKPPARKGHQANPKNTPSWSLECTHGGVRIEFSISFKGEHTAFVPELSYGALAIGDGGTEEVPIIGTGV